MRGAERGAAIPLALRADDAAERVDLGAEGLIGQRAEAVDDFGVPRLVLLLGALPALLHLLRFGDDFVAPILARRHLLPLALALEELAMDATREGGVLLAEPARQLELRGGAGEEGLVLDE